MWLQLPASAEQAARLENQTLWRAKGCLDCLNGYRGRLGLFEVLVMNDELAEAIRTAISPRRIQERSVAMAMKTLWMDGTQKILDGETSMEEVLRVVGHAR